MSSTFSGNITFWRACCLVLALIAASEALGLVLVSRPSPASPPTASSGSTRTLPAATPDADVAAPAVTTEKAEPLRLSASFRKHALAAQDPLYRARAWEDRGISLAEKETPGRPCATWRDWLRARTATP